MFKRITWTVLCSVFLISLYSCVMKTLKPTDLGESDKEKYGSSVGDNTPIVTQAKDAFVTTVNFGLAEDRAYSLAVNDQEEIFLNGTSETGYRRDFSIASYLADGQLNTAFGKNGATTTDIKFEYDYAKKVLLQADGKIIAIGYTQDLNNSQNTYDFSAVRYLKTGALDPSFGVGGKVVIDFEGALRHDYAVSGALQNDGKIILAGYSQNALLKYNVAVSRLNADGSLDTSFGVGGKVLTAPDTTGNYYAMDVKVDSVGNIVVAGYRYVPGYDFLVIRYDKNGILDPTFATGGVLITPVGASHDFATALALQSDGGIVVAGYSYVYVTGVGWSYNVSAIRCKSNGVLDASFANAGKLIFVDNAVIISSKMNEYGRAVDIDPDGNIFIAGNVTPITAGSSSDVMVVKFKPNGVVATGFANNGVFLKDIAGKIDIAHAIAIKGHNVFVAGEAQLDKNTDYLLLKFDLDGLVDMNFGFNGIVTTEVGRGGNTRGMEMVSLPNGKFYVVGHTFNGSDTDMAVGLFNEDSSLDIAYGNMGMMTKDFLVGEDYARGAVALPDGSIIISGHSANATSKADFTSIKVTPSGFIDNMSGFGTDGASITPLNTTADDWMVKTVPFGEDKFIGAGSVSNGTNYDIAIARYKLDSGGLDPSFATGGVFKLQIGTGHDSLANIMLQPDKKIIAVGTYVAATMPTQKNNAFIIRLNTDGTLDPAFGTGGIVTLDMGAGKSGYFTDAAIIPDKNDPVIYNIMVSGRIMTGPVEDRNYQPILAMYDSNGVLVPSFGNAGIVKIEKFATAGHSNMLFKDDVIYTIGFTLGTRNNGLVMAFNRDGSFYEGFGDNGVFQLAESYSPFDDVFFAFYIRDDGKMLVTGYSCNGFNDELLILRLTADGKLDTK